MSRASSMTLLQKIRWHLQYRWMLLRFAFFGRRITCWKCGKPIGKVITRVDDGSVVLEGAQHGQIVVDFETRDSLRFRHADLSECNYH